ncbi:protein traS [Yersinia enterocolitica]
MKRSEVERDAFFILESLNEKDYEIPSNKKILGVLFKKIWPVYILQIAMILADCYVYFDRSASFLAYVISVLELLLLSSGSMLFFTLAFVGSLYGPVTMSLVIGKDVMKKSVLMQILAKKIRFYGKFLLLFNTLVGLFLLYFHEAAVAALGLSWFGSFIFSGIILQGSMSRYMTPAAIDTVTKIKAIISPDTK